MVSLHGVLVLLLAVLGPCHSANILAVMPCASRSHHIWNRALAHELARRGHHVTYFSPDKDPNPPKGLRQIHAEDTYAKVQGEVDIQSMVDNQGPLDITNEFDEFGLANCKAVISSKGADELIQVAQKETFDLVIFDITLTECLYPIADFIPNAPVIGVTAYGGTALVNYLTGNPESLAFKPNTYLPFLSNMTLWERVQNVLIHWYTTYDRFQHFLPEQLAVAQTKFPHAKSLHHVLDRLSLVLVNNHYTFDPPTPAVPALIHVGGMHITPPKPLPQDMQTFLDGAKNGAIFFALGSNVQSSKVSKHRLQMILNVLEKLAPIRILWKFEEELAGKPTNVMISKWLPQNDILAHPNVKLFFTHSGLLSTQESIYHGKPMVGMPFLVDQFINLNRCIRDGVALKVDFLTFNEATLLGTIRKVWDNPQYRNKAEEMSKIFRDQPQTPLERAVFWVEYVHRHKGAKHLRSPSLNLAWYENQLLDVALVLAGGIVILLYLANVIIRAVFGTSNKSKKKLKQR